MPITVNRLIIGHLELILKLNIIGILRVLFVLVPKKFRINVSRIIINLVVFILLHVLLVGYVWKYIGSYRAITVMIINVDAMDILLYGLPCKKIRLYFLEILSFFLCL